MQGFPPRKNSMTEESCNRRCGANCDCGKLPEKMPEGSRKAATILFISVISVLAGAIIDQYAFNTGGIVGALLGIALSAVLIRLLLSSDSNKKA
jgi:hypothetical protein